MYIEEKGENIRTQFIQFPSLLVPFNNSNVMENNKDLGQHDLISWWRMHMDGAPKLQHLVIRLLSNIASSSTTKRNRSTYSFIHFINRNILTSKRAEKLVAMHRVMNLEHRKTLGYFNGPATWWNVNSQDDAHVGDEDGANAMQHKLVGVSFSILENAMTMI